MLLSQPRHWCLEMEDLGEAALLRFTGNKIRLSEQHVQLVEEQLCRCAQELAGRQILLDLGNVECVASTALAKLVQLHDRLEAQGERLSLCGASPHIYECFEVTQLDHLLDVHRTVSEVPSGVG
jgi:anti-anti-sigma factor